MELAYSYLRMSSSEQLKGDSLRRQLKAGKLYAEKHNLTLDNSLRDLGVSAFKGKNRAEGALAEFHSMVASGKIPRGSFLLVESLDRLSRQTPWEAMIPFLELVKAGIRIVTLIDEQIYDAARLTAEPMALLTGVITQMRAHDESKHKSTRISEIWAHKQLNASPTKPITKRVPGWLRHTPTGFEVIPERAAVVLRIFEDTAKGMGRHAICTMLNQSGVKSMGGVRWNKTYVARLIHEDKVLGHYHPNTDRLGARRPSGPPVLNYYPAIVPLALVIKARDAAEERTKGAAGRKGTLLSNLFTGLAFCACGARMRLRIRSGTHGPSSLICGAVFDGGICAERRNFNYPQFEKAFLDHIGSGHIDLSVFDQRRSDRQQQIEAALAKLDTKIDMATRRLKAMTDAVGDGQSPKSLVARMLEMEAGLDVDTAARAEAEKELAALRQSAVSGADRVKEIAGMHKRLSQLQGDDLYRLRAQLRQQIHRIVERITFHGDEWIDIKLIGTEIDPEMHYSLLAGRKQPPFSGETGWSRWLSRQTPEVQKFWRDKPLDDSPRNRNSYKELGDEVTEMLRKSRLTP